MDQSICLIIELKLQLNGKFDSCALVKNENFVTTVTSSDLSESMFCTLESLAVN